MNFWNQLTETLIGNITLRCLGIFFLLMLIWIYGISEPEIYFKQLYTMLENPLFHLFVAIYLFGATAYISLRSYILDCDSNTSQDGGEQSQSSGTQSQDGGAQSQNSGTQSQDGGAQSQNSGTQSQDGGEQPRSYETLLYSLNALLLLLLIALNYTGIIILLKDGYDYPIADKTIKFVEIKNMFESNEITSQQIEELKNITLDIIHEKDTCAKYYEDILFSEVRSDESKQEDLPNWYCWLAPQSVVNSELIFEVAEYTYSNNYFVEKIPLYIRERGCHPKFVFGTFEFSADLKYKYLTGFFDYSLVNAQNIFKENDSTATMLKVFLSNLAYELNNYAKNITEPDSSFLQLLFSKDNRQIEYDGTRLFRVENTVNSKSYFTANQYQNRQGKFEEFNKILNLTDNYLETIKKNEEYTQKAFTILNIVSNPGTVSEQETGSNNFYIVSFSLGYISGIKNGDHSNQCYLYILKPKGKMKQYSLKINAFFVIPNDITFIPNYITL